MKTGVMDSKTRAVYETIRESRELPSPTGVALEILDLARRETTTAAQIAAVIETDPAISSRLLKIVNSPLAGMPRQIVSIERAVALLGHLAITNLALGFSLVSNHKKGRCAGFDYDLFWSESIARAVAVRHTADRTKGFAPDEAFTCGLLSQVGRLGLATAFPEDYAEVLERFAGALDATLTQTPLSLTQIERSTFGIDHNELAAAMMTDWRVPEIFREAVRHQELPMKGGTLDAVPEGRPADTTVVDDPIAPLTARGQILTRILHLSGSISLIITQPAVYRDSLSKLAFEAEAVGIDAAACRKMFDAIVQDWHQTAAVLDVQTRQVPPLQELYVQASTCQEALGKKRMEPAPCTLGEGLNVEK